MSSLPLLLRADRLLPPGNPTLDNLITSLHDYGNPLIPIYAVSFLETLFSLEADIAYDPAYDQTAVQAAVLLALRQNYSFAKRSLAREFRTTRFRRSFRPFPAWLP